MQFGTDFANEQSDLILLIVLCLVFHGLLIILYNYICKFVSFCGVYTSVLIRDGTILCCIGVSQYIMFQYMYQYCKLSIDASESQCIDQ